MNPGEISGSAANGVTGTHVRVVVVGAGIAGIGAALRLAAEGERDFLLLERNADVGGTWLDNVYPGVACDVPSHLYSFSFAPKPDWPQYFADGAQIQDYLRSCTAGPEFRDRLSLETDLLHAQWEEDQAHWSLTTSRGELTASFLVLATGRFSTPRLPAIPNLAEFDGPVVHTARWQDLDVPGQRIGVIGTGASAAQLVPALAQRSAELTVFQRSPPWVVPKGNRPYSPTEQALFVEDDQARRRHRSSIVAEMDAGLGARFSGSCAHADLRRRVLKHLESEVPDPALRAQLTPDYEPGCKRVLLSDDWYRSLQRENVVLEPSALASVSGSTATAASGASYAVDALVFATGFLASRPAIAAAVTGRERSLAEHWSAGMTSYASTVVTGFPNMFILGGPHSALGHNSAVEILETQIEHLLSALAHLPTGSVCEVAAEAEEHYSAAVHARAEQTVWTGCSNWYRDQQTGRVTLLWPDTAESYRRQHSRFAPDMYRIRTPAPGPADRTPATVDA
ncbi:NAD(P)/FAD-dependent oxidoreductase [Nesterenkonia salmonea]|uniref:NAD(P)/FAD-dependent oxidoreductase n=1 Tax=Nesterenkonia salmonea TaxID=1804987 RepID=A0A5R9BKG0_9MICC|nr:NAD(P)/FAD-dependent oxidoreductase [Nesterenkonia salmonea]TLQ01099.1 NAD(P)/FAD-dependent oxidoreductase [Nesterenkonia salmonea]